VAKNYYDITIAFAGINQAARLVQELSLSGTCDGAALRCCLNSIIDVNPVSTVSVFGGEANLKPGLEIVLGLLNASPEKMSTEIMRYCGGIMMLERRLSANGQALEELSRRIAQIERQLNHFEIDSDNIIGALSDIYIDVVSPLGSKIQVVGSPEALQRASVQAKVRALLLAGVRAAVLWRQVGGGRLQLLFARRHINEQAKQIFNRI
jgi:high frequency lysogenization protein